MTGTMLAGGAHLTCCWPPSPPSSLTPTCCCPPSPVPALKSKTHLLLAPLPALGPRSTAAAFLLAVTVVSAPSQLNQAAAVFVFNPDLTSCREQRVQGRKVALHRATTAGRY